MGSSAEEMRKRLSCADSAFPKLSHDVSLAVIRDLGIPAVDICLFAGFDHNPPHVVAEAPEAVADKIQARLERHELAVADVFVILGTSFDELAVNHPDPGVRAESLRRFEAVVTFAGRLSSPGITLLPGTTFDGVPADESLALATRELRRRVEIAGAAGLELSVEAHYQSVAPTPARAVELLDQAPDLTLTLDHSHFLYQEFSQDDVDALIPRSRHVQLRQAGPGRMQLPAHGGAIDIGLFVERLDKTGYTGYLGLEYQREDWLDCNQVDCISETAELRDILLALG